MTKEQKPVDIIAAFGQLDTLLANVARLMGAYHKELKATGMPDDLAADLHQEFLESQFPNNHKGYGV